MADDDDYAEGTRRKPDRVTFPGYPTGKLKLPPPVPRALPDEPTRNDLPSGRARDPWPTLPGSPAPPSVAPPAPSMAPAPPVRKQHQSVSPAPWASEAERAAINRHARARGDHVVEQPRSVPPPSSTATPIVMSPTRRPPWWEREEGVNAVLKGLGALVTVTLGALVTYRATQPPPPPATDIQCPSFADDKAHRNVICTQVHQLEEALGTLQAERDAQKAREERARKMLGQEPPTLEKK